MKEKFTLNQGDDKSFVEIEYPLTVGNPRVYFEDTEYKPVNTGANMNRGLAFDLPIGRFTIKTETVLWMPNVGIRLNGKHIPKSLASPMNRVRPAAYMAWFLAVVIIIFGILGLFKVIQSEDPIYDIVFIGFGIVYALLGWGVYKMNHACSMTIMGFFMAHSVWGIIHGGIKNIILYLIIIWFFAQGLLATRDAEREKIEDKKALN